MTKNALIPCLLACLWLPTSAASAGENAVDATADINSALPLAGHSEHGAAFNEGPRQNAYLMGSTGKVHFPITTVSDQAQQFFDQGVGQLHGFWFYEAERSFRRVRNLDATCAMASWGMAMANLDNAKRARKFIGEAVNRIELQESATDRERLYIEALAKFLKEDDRDDTQHRQDYVKAIEKIIRGFPDDLEAKAFLAVNLWRNSSKGLPITSHAAVDALIGQVLAVEPTHPAHHYRIHLWDHEEPGQALTSAARCGQASPAIAHMWHMPGHIYSRLKRYNDAVWQQEASARADHAYMMRDRVLPDQIHNYAHNNEWLIRNLVHLGRWRDALALAKNMLELPRHPKYNNFGRDGQDSCQYGRQRLMQVLETFELWNETAELANTMYLEPTDDLNEQAKRLRLLAIAYHHLGKWSDFAACRQELDALVEQVESKAQAAIAAAQPNDVDSPSDDAESTAEQKEDDGAVATDEGAADEGAADEGAADEEAADEEAADEEAADEGAADKEAADKEAADKEAADKEAADAAENVRKEHAVVANARRELDGLSLLASGNQDGAAATLGECEDLSATRKARYAFRWGDHELAKTTIAEAVKTAKNETAPLAIQVDLLRRMDDLDNAKTTFAQLRTVAAHADLDAPPFATLAPLAATCMWPEDWRLAEAPADDVGDRPELESLGPFRWSPVPAADWSLPAANNRPIRLADYSGRPVVVILYLGHGCLHCTEQLQTFLPRRSDFAAAGIELVAISTDDVQALALSIRKFSDENRFEIDLVADPDHEVFKAYRCYDDFEQAPLHGTFLVDARGLIRWHDIGYEPFNDVDFLLNEVKRLLSIATEGR